MHWTGEFCKLLKWAWSNAFLVLNLCLKSTILWPILPKETKNLTEQMNQCFPVSPHKWHFLLQAGASLIKYLSTCITLENVSNPSLFRKEWHFRLTQSTLFCAQPEACAQVCCWTRNREGPSLWQVRYQSRVNPLPIPQCLENWEHSAANTYCSLSWRRPCHLELHQPRSCCGATVCHEVP